MAEEKKSAQELGAEIAEIRKTAKDQAQNNVITSRFMKTKTVKINKGESDEQTFLLQFPGTVRASQMIDDSSNPFGNTNMTYFMGQAIDKIIVEPKIKDLAYFDTHHGYHELYDAVYSFLTDGLN